MTLETQPMRGRSGQARYRVDPTNPCNVQMQTGSGERWLWHSTYGTPEEVQAAVLRLGRGQPEQVGDEVRRRNLDAVLRAWDDEEEGKGR